MKYGPYILKEVPAEGLKVGDVWIASQMGFAWRVIGVNETGDPENPDDIRIRVELEWTGKGDAPWGSAAYGTHIFEVFRKGKIRGWIAANPDEKPHGPCYDSDCPCVFEVF